MHFDLVDLRLLLAIVESGSLSKAAASFPIALSAASNRLRHFEERSGVTLFTRTAEGMVLTPAGRLVLDRAREVLAQAEQLRETVRDLTGRKRITLCLAGTTVANSSFLPAALGPFLADYPEVDLQLLELKSTEIIQRVAAGEIEIGVYDGNVPTRNLITLPFRHDRLVMLVPQDHALAGRASAPLRDALDYPFICLPPERAMQRFVEAMAIENARPLTIRVRAPSFDAIAQLVAQNAGIAMLPEEAARQQRELPVRIVALEDSWAMRDLCLCILSREGLSTHARQLLTYLQTEPDA